MNRDELHRRLMKTFAVEMEEHLQTMVETLDYLNTSSDTIDDEAATEQVNQLFRAFHSLKGAARSVDLQEIEENCHQLESLLVSMQAEKRMPTDRELQRLYQGLLWLQESSALPPAINVTGSKPENLAANNIADNNKTPTAQVSPPINTDKRQNSVRLPAERLDNLLALVAEVQLVSRSGAHLLEEIDELSSRYDQLSTSIRLHQNQKKSQIINDNNNTNRNSNNSTRAFRSSEDKQSQQFTHMMLSLRKHAAKFLFELDLAIEPLEREVHISRLQPFRLACEQILSLVNTQRYNDTTLAKLKLEGKDLELDRALIEGLKPILMHLIRNALDHGIETPHLRIQQGKPEAGQLLVKAQRIKGFTCITVQDDGQGIDETKLLQVLSDKQMAVPQERDSLLNTLFEPGFSTTSAVSMTSGRGMGLDAVRNAVLAMRGTITIESEAGKGVRFNIQLPQTLSAYNVLIVEIGNTQYAIDAAQIKLTRKIIGHELIQSDQETFVVMDNIHYPLGNLEQHLGHFSDQANYTVIVSDGRSEKAMLVEDIIGLESLIVKDLEHKLGKIAGISGGAIMSDGSVTLVLDTAVLLKQSQGLKTTLTATETNSVKPTALTVLVVEDSLTTRILEVNVLKSEGYQVLAAVDGQHAWELLRENPVDLIVSDVDMPRLNGFELTRRLRDSAKWSHIPVILLTARETSKDKLEGLDAGAKLYMKKSHFDQTELLDAVKRLAPC